MALLGMPSSAGSGERAGSGEPGKIQVKAGAELRTMQRCNQIKILATK